MTSPIDIEEGRVKMASAEITEGCLAVIDGYLLWAEGSAYAGCQVGELDDWPKLLNAILHCINTYEPLLDELKGLRERERKLGGLVREMAEHLEARKVELEDVKSERDKLRMKYEITCHSCGESNPCGSMRVFGYCR